MESMEWHGMGLGDFQDLDSDLVISRPGLGLGGIRRFSALGHDVELGHIRNDKWPWLRHYGICWYLRHGAKSRHPWLRHYENYYYLRHRIDSKYPWLRHYESYYCLSTTNTAWFNIWKIQVLS